MGVQVHFTSKWRRSFDRRRGGICRGLGWQLHRDGRAHGKGPVAYPVGRGSLLLSSNLHARRPAIRGDSRWRSIIRVCISGKLGAMRAVLGFVLFAGGIAAGGQGASSASAIPHIGKGYELEQNDRYAEAAQEFRAALAIDPAAVNARYQLAICLFALGEPDASRKEFERLRAETKDDPNVAYYLARIDLLAGDAAAAIRRLVPLMSHP